MSYITGKNEGVYSITRRFAFTNVTDEVFVSQWGGQPIIVKPHQTVELPHYLAEKMTNELVDKIMITDVKMEESKSTVPYYRSPRGSSLGVPAARRPLEEKIVKELQVDDKSPEMKLKILEVQQEVLSDIQRSAEPTGTVSDIQVAPAEFAELETKKTKKK